MPPSRRRGNAHTSKGSSSSTRRDEGVPSSSQVKGERGANTQPNKTAEQRAAEEEERRLEEEASENLERIQQLLEKFDNQEEPLTVDGSDAKLKSLRSDWASMEGNFEIAYQVVTQVAERLAEARAAEGLIDEDEDLQAIDNGMQKMIDLQETVKHRRKALEEIRGSVADKQQVLNAAETYTDRSVQLDDEYKKKTMRQRYAQSKVYQDYKTTVWSALRDDDMPALIDLLPRGEGDENNDDDDDDIVAYGVDRTKFKCPISLHIMVDPLKSTVCQHAFEKDSILEYLGNGTKPCPTGCQAKLNKRTLVSDPAFTRSCRKYAHREEARKDRERTQHQSTMLD